MKKADLILQISKQTGVNKIDVLVTFEALLKEIKVSLSVGENIYIRGFGSFINKRRAAKIGRNIKKNEAIHIPEHYIPAFRPSREFITAIKQQTLQHDQERSGPISKG